MNPEIILKRRNDLLKEISEWLETHNGVFPKPYVIKNKKNLKITEMSPEEAKQVKLARRWEKHFKEEKELYEEYKKSPIEEVPEEYKAIVKALNKSKKIKPGKKIKKILTLVEWMKLHDKKFPKAQKEKVENQTEEQKEEEKMYRIYRAPFVKRVEEEYKDFPIEEIPEEFREYMEMVRSRGIKTKYFKEMISWLETHDGKAPKFSKRVNGRRLNRSEMTEEEKKEARLNSKWASSDEKKILESYIGVPIERIPEEYRTYIEKMRSFRYGIKEDCYPEIISWLEKHGGNLPRGEVGSVKDSETEEIKYEEELRKKWNKSVEKKLLDKYIGFEIEEIPEEYRERIATLREYGLGMEEKDCYEQIIEWLETHNGKMPRADVRIDGKPLKRGELEKAKRKEVLLRYRWNVSEIKKVLDDYAEEPLETVPEEYREKVKVLRGYGLGLVKRKEYDTYNEIVEWLKNNNGKYPRTTIVDEEGNRKIAEEFTKEESYEISLSHRWYRTMERKIFLEYEERPIEEVPEEYREKVETLRRYKKEQPKKHSKSILDWLEKHNGALPRAGVYRNGIRIKTDEMTEEEIEECKEYRSWKHSKLKSVLNEYAERPLEEVPEEYRDDIRRLREYGILGKKKNSQITTRMKKSVGKQVNQNEDVRDELGTDLLKDNRIK